MELHDWLLALHILSAFAWIAALVLYTVVIVSGRRLSVPSDVLRLFRVSPVGDVLIAVGMTGTIVFGIWLAFEADGYAIWDGWIIAALVLWLVAARIGEQLGRIYNGARDRARSLVDEGRDAPSAELGAALRSRRGLVLHVLLLVVVFVLLVDMIFKPGA